MTSQRTSERGFCPCGRYTQYRPSALCAEDVILLVERALLSLGAGLVRARSCAIVDIGTMPLHILVSAAIHNIAGSRRPLRSLVRILLVSDMLEDFHTIDSIV